jgi:hypothetical protein
MVPRQVIRRFAPVAGFAFTERSFGATPPRSVFLNIQARPPPRRPPTPPSTAPPPPAPPIAAAQMAQRDPRAWEQPGKFLLRPIAEYHRKSVGFAEPAVAPLLSSPNSHSCPAKELGLQMRATIP